MHCWLRLSPKRVRFYLHVELEGNNICSVLWMQWVYHTKRDVVTRKVWGSRSIQAGHPGIPSILELTARLHLHLRPFTPLLVPSNQSPSRHISRPSFLAEFLDDCALIPAIPFNRLVSPLPSTSLVRPLIRGSVRVLHIINHGFPNSGRRHGQVCPLPSPSHTLLARSLIRSFSLLSGTGYSKLGRTPDSFHVELRRQAPG